MGRVTVRCSGFRARLSAFFTFFYGLGLRFGLSPENLQCFFAVLLDVLKRSRVLADEGCEILGYSKDPNVWSLH